ncbi:MAG: hypothetical protein Q4F65_05630 [Propionibacteriaceae bacterium]|nr:hypothetical protein [Propionibacteriaceae bacterium]
MDNGVSGRTNGIEWRLIAPGAVLLLLGLINAGRMDDPGAFMPRWVVLGAVAIGGALLLLGVIRTVRARNTTG